MRFPNFRSMGIGALGAAAALCVAAAPSAASADVQWLVNGTFNDGTTLTGTFTLNVYGYIESNFVLTTQPDAADGFVGMTYDFGGVAPNKTGNTLDFFNGYNNDLHLQFADNLSVAGPSNDILTGGVSFECQDAFTCPSADTTRYLTSGFATYVPEPAAWVLMILGLGLAGGVVRGRRGLGAAAA